MKIPGFTTRIVWCQTYCPEKHFCPCRGSTLPAGDSAVLLIIDPPSQKLPRPARHFAAQPGVDPSSYWKLLPS